MGAKTKHRSNKGELAPPSKRALGIYRIEYLNAQGRVERTAYQHTVADQSTMTSLYPTQRLTQITRAVCGCLECVHITHDTD